MKRLLLSLIVVTNFAIAVPAEAKKPDCRYKAYGCTYEGFLNGDGTANFRTICRDDWGDSIGWHIVFNDNVPAGACGQ